MSEERSEDGEEPEGEAPSRWIVSARVDLAMMLFPFLITLVILSEPKPDKVSLLSFLFLVVAFDVAHVWSSVYISYLDREVFNKRKLLFLLPIPLTILISYRLYLHSPMWFWSLMAYVAIHHFASQQYGFVALYKLRGQERDPLDRYLDKWTLWVGALGPILYWHTQKEVKFDWFGHGETFLLPLYSFQDTLRLAIQSDILILMGVFATVYSVRQLQHAWRGQFNLGKNLWMLGSWASWSIGICYAQHPLVSLACINLFHGIPFLILVWYRVNRHWAAREAAGTMPEGFNLVAWLADPKRLWLFYGVLLCLAVAEEGLWEAIVWGNHLPKVTTLSPEGTALAVAILSTPQIVHYYLDAWLWKFDGSNPDLFIALGVKK